MTRYFEELRRRNVFRVAAVYIVGSWLLLQVADVLFDALSVPAGAMRLLLALLALGFVPALVFAWVFEMTPEGLKREKDIPHDASITRVTGQKLDRVILVILACAVVVLLIDRAWNHGDLPTRVESSGQALPTATQAPGTGPATAGLSIAVLPFANRSADAADEYFVEGIHDDILTRLAKIGALRVISRTSVMQYKDTTKPLGEIGRDLGVSNVVEGAVQRAGDRVRVTVQLINAGTDEHLWAESYDRELTAANIFAIQSEVASTIAHALEASLSPKDKTRLERQGTASLDAYEAYVQGRYFFNRRSESNLQPAVEKFETAVALDPNYAEAWAGLASAYVVIPGWINVSRDEYYMKGREAAMRAIALEPSLGEPYGTLAGIAEESGRWIESEEGFAKSLADDPNNATVNSWYGELLSDVGRIRDAVARFSVAEGLDPTGAIPMIHKSFAMMMLEQDAEALALCDKADQLIGKNFWTQAVRARMALRQGRPDEARALMRDFSTAGTKAWPDEVFAALEDPALVPQALAALAGHVEQHDTDTFFIMTSYGLLNAMDALYEHVDDLYAYRAVTAKTFWLPELSEARKDPRFKDFAERTGLLDYWRKFGWPQVCRPVDDSFACD